MKFGIKLPHSGALAGVDAIKRIALEAEDLGYDTVWVHDHVTYDTDWFVHRASGTIEQTEGIEPDFYESLSTLTWVAGFTERVRLGIAVLVLPLRDPRVLARQAMTLQALSKGRLLLGVGLGDYHNDFQVMNIPYMDRIALTDEYLDVLTTAFRGGNVDYQGETISFRNASYYPRVPEIPILYGGGIVHHPEPRGAELFRPSLRRLARWCHGWVPEGNPRLIKEGLAEIKQLAQEEGRGDVEMEIVPYIPLYVGDDAVAQQKSRKSLEAEILSFEEGLSESLIGSVDTLCRRVETYEESGATMIGLRCWAEDLDSFVDMIRTLSREVMPRFR